MKNKVFQMGMTLAAIAASLVVESHGQVKLEEVSRTDVPGYHIGLAVGPHNSVLLLSPGNKLSLLGRKDKPETIVLPAFPEDVGEASLSDVAFSDGYLFFSALGKSSLLAVDFPDGKEFQEMPLRFLDPGTPVAEIIAWDEGLIVGTFGGTAFFISPKDRGTPMPNGTALASTPSEEPLAFIVAHGEEPAKRWTARQGKSILFPVEGFEFADNLTNIRLVGQDVDDRIFLEATYDLGEDGVRVEIIAIAKDGGIAKAAFEYANLIELGRRCVVLPNGTAAFLHAELGETWQVVKFR